MGIKQDPVLKTWIVNYSKRPGKNLAPVSRTRAGIISEREARRVFNELVVEVQRKIETKKTPSWEIVVKDFLMECRENNYAQKTVESYRYALEAHTFDAWASRLVTQITRAEIVVLHKEKVGASAPGNQRYFLKCLRIVFQSAVEAGHIPVNPVPQMKFRVGDKIKKVLTWNQASTLLNKAREMDHEWYPIWASAVYTGMRNGELYALTWDKVDFENNLILVDSSWNSLDGFKCTKSGDDRVVEISPGLLPILKALKLKRVGTFVLPRIYKWDKGEQARELRMFLMGVGLPEIRFHDLRATWATLLLSKGVEPIKVMSMGGWKDIETMMIYARKAGVDIRGSTRCLNLHEPITRTAEIVLLPVCSSV